MIRADYRPTDPLFGPVSETQANDLSARFYLRHDQAGRSRLIANRVLSLVLNTGAAGVIGSWVVLGLWGTLEDGGAGASTADLIVYAVLILVFVMFAWFALKSHSWIRWMVRNWGAPPMVPRGPVSLDIFRVWFTSQFIRKYIKAHYRAGDSVLVGFHRVAIRFYPEEYLCSGKVWRTTMIGFTLVLVYGALWMLSLLQPASWSADLHPMSSVLLVIFIIALLGGILSWQSFLRWMLRHWTAPRETPAPARLRSDRHPRSG
jgi:hypothetical protein